MGDPRRLTSRVSYSNVVATLALFVALGGTSVAAFRVGSREIRNNSVRTADLRNGDVRGRDIRDSSITRRDIASNTLGSREVGGLSSGDFAAGQLPDPFPAALPPRKTQKGVFAASVTGGPEDAGIARTPISFPVAMASAPALTYVAEKAPPTRACPGRASDPQAAAGNLCVYEAKAIGEIFVRGSFDPVTGDNFKATRFGSVAFVNGFTGAAIRGTWAVTAP